MNVTLADVIKLRWNHTELGWAINPMTVVLIKRGKFGDVHVHTKIREPYEWRWKQKLEWWHISQGMPRSAGQHCNCRTSSEDTELLFRAKRPKLQVMCRGEIFDPYLHWKPKSHPPGHYRTKEQGHHRNLNNGTLSKEKVQLFGKIQCPLPLMAKRQGPPIKTFPTNTSAYLFSLSP